MRRAYCEVDECIRSAARDGLCWGHHKARRNGTAGRVLRVSGGPHPSQQYRSPFERFLEAVLHLVEVDALEGPDWKRAVGRARKAARRWVGGPGPRRGAR